MAKFVNQNKYVCYKCQTARLVGQVTASPRDFLGYGAACPRCGSEMKHVHYGVKVPTSNDDHTGWKRLYEDEHRPAGLPRRHRRWRTVRR